MAGISNLVVDQGTTFSSIITVADQTGTPLNITNYTVKSQFRKSYQSSSATNFTASIYDATTGRIRLQLAPSDTSNIQAGRYLYDIELTSPTGDKFRALEGLVIITPEITQT
jgi:uncharacterized cupin superfamily protein